MNDEEDSSYVIPDQITTPDNQIGTSADTNNHLGTRADTNNRDSDPDQISDISEPEIISLNGVNNGGSSDSSTSHMLAPPITNLPSTVTYLEGPNNSQVYIVGTAHFSEESQQDVIRTLELVRPHIVCLELCKSRLHVIKCSEEEILEEVRNIGISKMRELISRSGMFYGIFQLAFLHLSAGLTKQLGLAPGGEFRAAYRKGRELGCTFRLSDRSIQTTLRRAIYSLTMWKQVGLAVKLLFNNEKITKEDVESFKGDLLQKLIEEIEGEYPNLSRIFVDERDQYLSRKIYESACENTAHICRVCNRGAQHNREGSKSEGEEEGEREEEGETDSEENISETEDETVTIDETTRVVAVVGIGHISGIKKYWGADIDCEEICKIPEPSIQTVIVGKTIKYMFLSLILYSTYKTASFVYNVLSPYLPSIPWSDTVAAHYGNFTSYLSSLFS